MRNLACGIPCDRDTGRTRDGGLHIRFAATPLRDQLSLHSLEITVNASACRIIARANFQKSAKVLRVSIGISGLAARARASWSNRSIENPPPRGIAHGEAQETLIP